MWDIWLIEINLIFFNLTQNARAKDKKSRNSRCYTDDDSLHQTSSVASPDIQLDDCKICGIQKGIFHSPMALS